MWGRGVAREGTVGGRNRATRAFASFCASPDSLVQASTHQTRSAKCGSATGRQVARWAKGRANATADCVDRIDLRIRVWRLSRGPRLGLLRRRRPEPHPDHRSDPSFVARNLSDIQADSLKSQGRAALADAEKARLRAPFLAGRDKPARLRRPGRYLPRARFRFWRRTRPALPVKG